jgi:MPBQ/MSBQ methyltransferase
MNRNCPTATDFNRVNGTPAIDDSTPAMDVVTSYDGSNVVYRLLRLDTWGPALMNLGYYRFPWPIAFLNWAANLELAQRRLVIKAINLMHVGSNSRLLDVACGRGKSSFMLHCMYPDSTVVGLDLLNRNIQVAQTLFDQIDNLSYTIGNAEELDFESASFEGVMCIEAAFHFPDRMQFLREAYRVLKPGGRLVVVDFAWNDSADRIHRNDARARIVRNIWQWDDLYDTVEYQTAARQIGFHMNSLEDWSYHVVDPIQSLFDCLSVLGNSWLGRAFLCWRNPLYRSFSTDDWKEVARAAEAHRFVRHHSKYVAFVFQKPNMK